MDTQAGSSSSAEVDNRPRPGGDAVADNQALRAPTDPVSAPLVEPRVYAAPTADPLLITGGLKEVKDRRDALEQTESKRARSEANADAPGINYPPQYGIHGRMDFKPDDVDLWVLSFWLVGDTWEKC